MATIKVRVGQKNGVKVVASNTSVSTSAVGSASDVDTGARATNTFLMYDGTEYIHVDASQIMDLADTVDNDTIDYGSF
jgi:hypothetical protein